ncbi:hypothetical protein GS434_20595 [Rhodococcus hoagii]|nr:hypothetical protein [Prescottella equi]
MSIYRHETPRIPTGAVAARIDLPDHPPQPVNPAFKFQILREASEVRIYGEVAVAHHHSIFAAATARQPRVLKIQTSIPSRTSPAVDNLLGQAPRQCRRLPLGIEGDERARPAVAVADDELDPNANPGSARPLRRLRCSIFRSGGPLAPVVIAVVDALYLLGVPI